jgi:hypothetical protein
MPLKIISLKYLGRDLEKEEYAKKIGLLLLENMNNQKKT